MHRRNFIKTLAVGGAGLILSSVGGLSLAEVAQPTTRRARELRAAILGEINFTRPTQLPQFINIFLYGGPSELAGNLTNIEEINANSQNPYPVQVTNPLATDTQITKNRLWKDAGGSAMEAMLTSGDMSIYRTINRIKDDSKSHGPSVIQNLVGHLDPTSPGIAATLAAVLVANNAFSKPVDQLILPFVSFDGEARLFQRGGLEVPAALSSVTLDANFNNPYARSNNGVLSVSNDTTLEGLAQSISARHAALSGVNDAFVRREQLARFISTNFTGTVVNNNLPIDPGSLTGAKIQYPATNFGNRLKAAVSLSVINPDTLFINVGSGGLGGWDDHSNSLRNYVPRMQELMAALQVAVQHLRLVGKTSVFINVFGDFGRNVNLNDSQGWDHGNNQNLYTLGGTGIAGRSLGKVVGKTKRIGTPFQNRQFTAPTTDSYQCEPFAIAATVYKYFGITNPQKLTGELAIDEAAPNERVA